MFALPAVRNVDGFDDADALTSSLLSAPWATVLAINSGIAATIRVKNFIFMFTSLIL